MLTLTKKPNQLELLETIKLSHEDINQCYFKAQCSTYPGLSHIDTFFKLQLQLNNKFSHIFTTISSGKYLSQKATILFVTNHQGETIKFGFHNNKICLLMKDKQQEFDCTPNGTIQAYENVLESLYQGNNKLFISPAIAMEALRIITPVLNKDVIIHKYEPGVH